MKLVLNKKAAAVLASREVRYLLVGAASGLLNFLVFYLCFRLLGLWYVYATVLAGSIAWLLNFPLHKFWTFGDDRRSAMPLQGAAHFSLKMWNTYLLDPLLLYGMVEYLSVLPEFAKIAVGLLLGIQNYLLCRFVIFRRPAA